MLAEKGTKKNLRNKEKINKILKINFERLRIMGKKP